MPEPDLITLQYHFSYQTQSRGKLFPVELPVVKRSICIFSDLLQLDRYLPGKKFIRSLIINILLLELALTRSICNTTAGTGGPSQHKWY